MSRLDAESRTDYPANARLMAQYPPGNQSEPRDLGRTGTPKPMTQQPQLHGNGMAGVMEIALCRVAVVVALWLGH
ncbi:hypothetical protein [Sinimarinibacterium flocculans]|uniref:hypothetical protein n=1 Tax=Sinimarinibacterium flocculans TaxID=985250 RepID=UPI002492A091|nr:hypothetical protein [Sinimarinibacterium flocculans]